MTRLWDAGTVISAVRTWNCNSKFGARMIFTPTAGVVDAVIDNFAETCQTNNRPRETFFCSLDVAILRKRKSMRLTAESLSAKRGEDLIFHDISFQIESGNALVVTGPNGSGKSTLLRVLAGLLRPEAGAMRLEAEATSEAPLREACHYLGHHNAMKLELTVLENLVFWKAFLSNFHGGGGTDLSEAIDAVGLAGIAHLPFGYLSAGQQRRIAMTKLLVAWRPVWILDEPTAALDADADRMFAGLVRSHLSKGGIVIAATHQPLGLENAAELRMTGFQHGAQEVWLS